MKTPQYLKKGSKIALVAPARKISRDEVTAAVSWIRKNGFVAVYDDRLFAEYHQFAGDDDFRASVLQHYLDRDDIDAILCVRGGYGTIRIIDKLDFTGFEKHPKWIVGYSDITALHALWHKAGVKSLHAPMMKHLGEEPTHRTTRTLREVVAYYEKHGQFPPRHNGLFVRDWNAEHPEAQISADEVAFVGGNLSVMACLHGTPYDYDYEGKILFVEDISESPYKIDRMMQQLRLMGVLDKVRALVCGHFTGCDEDPLMPVKLWDNIRWIASPSGIPVIIGAPIGHEVENFPVVVG